MSFLIGYETEIGSLLPRRDLVYQLKKDLGLDIFEHEGGPRSYARWFIMNDRSIRFDRTAKEEPIFTHEIVSPVMQFNQGMDQMEKLFDWLRNNRSFANSTCGFHVGLSFSDINKQRKISPFKLLFHFDERKIAEKWGREDNRYCQFAKQEAIRLVDSSEISDHLNTLENIDYHIPRYLGKYRTINLGKLPNYIEFRIMGGNRYFTKFPVVQETINHFIDCLEKSITPDREFDAFLKEILDRKKKKSEKNHPKFIINPTNWEMTVYPITNRN